MHYAPDINVIVLNGLTLSGIEINEERDQVDCFTQCGRRFRFYHDQDCCESVMIHDIQGDVNSLIGSPVLSVKEEIHNGDYWPADIPPPEWSESTTWTVFTISTATGAVVFRWLGESNGYYSEAVSFKELTN